MTVKILTVKNMAGCPKNRHILTVMILTATTPSLEISDYHEKVADIVEYFRFLAPFLVQFCFLILVDQVNQELLNETNIQCNTFRQNHSAIFKALAAHRFLRCLE